MGIIYVKTSGSATNSGTRDTDAALVSGSAATVSGSVVTLDGSPDLSGLNTSGANQDAIYINDATNSARKIFWITAFDNSAKTVTVSVAPTGVTSSAWAIGGRLVWPSAPSSNFLNVPRAGDIIEFQDSPAGVSGANDIIGHAVNGTSAAGNVVYRGAAGTRPVLTAGNSAGAGQCIDASLGNFGTFRNFECAQVGTGSACTGAVCNTFLDLKVTDAGVAGIAAGTATRHIACEISGTDGDGLTLGDKSVTFGCYVHDVSGEGMECTGGNVSMIVLSSIVDTAAGRGVYWSGGPTVATNVALVAGNTIYGCGNSGLEIADQDAQVVLVNNILAENGNAAGEYNVDWVAGAAENVSFHAWNLFYHSGGGGGANLNGLTANAMVDNSELTSDPQFIDAAGGNFGLFQTSPAKRTGFPGQFLGGPQGYLDLGALQSRNVGPKTNYVLGV